MIFWLCFLFCIGSNASPLSRQRHQAQDWHLRHMEPGRRNDFQQFHPKHYATNVRSSNEKFPGMKTKFKNRAISINRNNNTNPPSLNMTQGITQEPYFIKADRFSDKIKMLAMPKTKPYASRKKHNSLNWNFRHQPTKENINLNDKLEPIASANSQVKRKISNNANKVTLSNFDQEVNQHPRRADNILNQKHSGKSDGNQHFGLDDGDELQKPSPNVEAVDRGVRFGAHHHRRPHKKTKHQKHIFGGNGLNSQGKNHKTFISQPTEDLADGKSPNELSKPSLGEDIQTVHGFSRIPLDEAANSLETTEAFVQNNSLNDEPQPIKKDEPNISKSNDSKFPLNEQSNQTEGFKRQDPLNPKELIDDGQQDRQMDESYIARYPEYANQTMDYESVSDSDDSTQEVQNDGSSTEETPTESTDLYQPIHFKLRDKTESIRRSMFNYNKTESPTVTKQVESKDISNDQDQYFDNEISNFGNETEFYPLSNEILSTYFETEYSVTPFTATQVTTDSDTTTNSFKKKSSSLETFHEQPLGSKDNYGNETSRMRKSYFAHKRSHQHPKSNGVSLIAKRNNDITTLDSNYDIHKNKFNGYGRETWVPKTVNQNNIHKNDLYNKRDKTEASTSIIQEYAFPTLGISNKILQSVSNSKKRSSPQKNNLKIGSFHANKKRFQNSPSNKLDQRESKIWKKPYLVESRNVNKSISTTQYPLQVNETDEPDKVLRDVPNNDEFSNQNSPQNDVVDKVTRTKEKSTQTIVTDGQSDNIIEKKEEKVVDRIQVQKQPLASGEGIGNQNNKDASEQFSEGNENYPNEYENYEYPDNVPPESDVGIHNKKKISNNLNTDEFQNPPRSSKSDYRDTTSEMNFQDKLNSNTKPVSPPLQPLPISNSAQDSKNVNSLNEKEIAKEFENLEPPNEDEYYYQESVDEKQPGGQQSSFSENENVNGPEQSTNNFIDLADQDGKKETVLKGLNEFPSAKQNNRPKNYQPNLGYEYRGQKGNFFQFSTVLPNLNDMGEFHREEKVERQSKIVHKNHGIMTNGSSSLFGEKKIEVKDNKQNYHETFMEEKGESKFPSESEDTELQKRDDQNSNFSNPSDQDEFDYQNPTSTKNKKNADFAGDNSYGEYYYEEENDPDSVMDSEEKNGKEYEDEYLVEPADVLQNEGGIDGISKRSGAFFDINKSMNNSKALESTVATPDNVSQSNNFIKKEITGKEVTTTTLSDDVSDIIGDNEIQLSKKNSNASSNAQMKPSSSIETNEQNLLQSQITNRQIEQETPPSNQTEVDPNENHESEMALGNKRDDVPLNVSTSGNTGSGNIEYVTISSTTNKDSQFNDFLNFEDERRQSRQLSRHQDDVNHRQKKHSPRHQTRRFSSNYRINRNSNHH